MAYRGMNFEWQEVQPADDARLYQRILDDGIISGCGLSSIGATLTVSTGYLIMTGRLIRVASVTNIDLSGETSGFARVLLQIDLSQAASETAFDQVSAIVQYASSAAEFPELRQDDINTGTSVGIYQAQLALCELSGSGISAIVQSMPEAEFI